MKKDFKQLLNEKGLKATAARLAVLGAFSGKCAPMSAEDVHAKIKRKGFDAVTVYRTLASFEKSGIVRTVDLRKEAACFELADGHHHHIVCTNCGLVEEFESAASERLARHIAQNAKDFKSILEHSFELFGLCRSCA